MSAGKPRVKSSKPGYFYRLKYGEKGVFSLLEYGNLTGNGIINE